jgi:hypothetical protein
MWIFRPIKPESPTAPGFGEARLRVFCRFAKMKKSGEGPLAAKGAPAIPGSPGRTTQDRPLAFATVPNFVPTTKPEGVLLAVCGTRLTLSSRYTCIAE